MLASYKPFNSSYHIFKLLNIIMKKLIALTIMSLAMTIGFSQKPGIGLLTPANHTLVLIDLEGQMAFATHNLHTT
jgi:hypothetical protein